MIWFIIAFAIAVIASLLERSFILGFGILLFTAFIALFLNLMLSNMVDGRPELSKTQLIAPLSDGKLVSIDRDISTYLPQGQVNTSQWREAQLIPSSSKPRIEIYNMRSGNIWLTVFGQRQEAKIYIPEDSVSY